MADENILLLTPGMWIRSLEHRQLCRVIATQMIGGKPFAMSGCRARIPLCGCPPRASHLSMMQLPVPWRGLLISPPRCGALMRLTRTSCSRPSNRPSSSCRTDSGTLQGYFQRADALRSFLDSKCLFPFRLDLILAGHLGAASCRLDVLRHGLEQDLMMLCEESRQEVMESRS